MPEAHTESIEINTGGNSLVDAVLPALDRTSAAVDTVVASYGDRNKPSRPHRSLSQSLCVHFLGMSLAVTGFLGVRGAQAFVEQVQDSAPVARVLNAAADSPPALMRWRAGLAF